MLYGQVDAALDEIGIAHQRERDELDGELSLEAKRDKRGCGDADVHAFEVCSATGCNLFATGYSQKGKVREKPGYSGTSWIHARVNGDRR